MLFRSIAEGAAAVGSTLAAGAGALGEGAIAAGEGIGSLAGEAGSALGEVGSSIGEGIQGLGNSIGDLFGGTAEGEGEVAADANASAPEVGNTVGATPKSYIPAGNGQAIGPYSTETVPGLNQPALTNSITPQSEWGSVGSNTGFSGQTMEVPTTQAQSALNAAGESTPAVEKIGRAHV